MHVIDTGMDKITLKFKTHCAFQRAHFGVSNEAEVTLKVAIMVLSKITRLQKVCISVRNYVLAQHIEGAYN